MITTKKEARKILKIKLMTKNLLCFHGDCYNIETKEASIQNSKEIKKQNFHKMKIVVDISIAANFYGKANDVMRIFYHFY